MVTPMGKNGPIPAERAKRPIPQRDLCRLCPKLVAALKQTYSDLQRFAPTSAGSEQARAILREMGEA